MGSRRRCHGREQLQSEHGGEGIGLGLEVFDLIPAGSREAPVLELHRIHWHKHIEECHCIFSGMQTHQVEWAVPFVVLRHAACLSIDQRPAYGDIASERGEMQAGLPNAVWLVGVCPLFQQGLDSLHIAAIHREY
eukprot:658354-Prymnesium_polylepis.7